MVVVLCATPLAWSQDLTFFHVSDTHYPDDADVEAKKAFLQKMRAHIDRMNDMSELAMPGGWQVATPKGVIHTGDIVDSGNRSEAWDNFVADFGLTGVDGRLKVPVYEGYGNHDQDSWLAGVTDHISTRNKTRPNVTHVSPTFQYPSTAQRGLKVTGLHYSWKWGGVHFVHLNLRAGDDVNRYPACGSLSFLKNYLENVVGQSKAPVFIAHHMPPASVDGEWSSADYNAYIEAIKNYNIVGILYGHAGGGFGVGTVAGTRTFKAHHVNGDASNWGATVFRIRSDPNTPNKGIMKVASRNLANNSWGTEHTYEIMGLAATTDSDAGANDQSGEPGDNLRDSSFEDSTAPRDSGSQAQPDSPRDPTDNVEAGTQPLAGRDSSTGGSSLDDSTPQASGCTCQTRGSAPNRSASLLVGLASAAALTIRKKRRVLPER